MQSKTDKAVSVWIASQIKTEMTRLITCGIHPVALRVKNFGIVHEKSLFVNRVEFIDILKFTDKVQLMVSEPVECAPKAHFMYCNIVVLDSTQSSTNCFIFPYVYERKRKNKLQDWKLIDSTGRELRLRVNFK
ncbi:hypothetical protein ADUPG1_000417 [Aduncisulcus paluster]|uniref:Uncharacterized protein n=1 Tax=Aduncisulcus paluster TaxID=2918883 RepID=A0ABQ5K863_9EUKA|nr:hypothetical protein ADUPG1_000417 [Aduncisulcus paluster]